ncbi:MAG: hypothetical protein AAGM22_32895, partial [Acidobacteriota bacterium]
VGDAESTGLWRFRSHAAAVAGLAPQVELFDRHGVALEGDPDSGVVLASGSYYLRVAAPAKGDVSARSDASAGQTQFQVGFTSERW